MGTTLTGTKPKDTYDSLIKVTDNGPLSGSLKALTDGLGNDSALALSTGAASVTGTLAVSAGTNLATASGSVGIGTASPAFKLDVDGVIRTRTGTDGMDVGNPSGNSYRANLLLRGTNASAANRVSYIGVNVFNTAGSLDVTSDADVIIRNGSTERARFLAGGGLTFNGDTAAANALDDYEEGTFSPTIIGTTTAGTATYGGGQQGLYTKIGRMVYFSIYLGYSGGTGTGNLRISGLPFTISAVDVPSISIGTFLNVALTALNIPIVSGIPSTTQLGFEQIPTGGGTQTAVPYDDSAVIVLSGFYQV